MPSLSWPETLAPGAVVLAAVSGGADSVAMLDLLVTEGRNKVVCWHLDHQLRPDSAADAAFVAALAGRLGVPAVIDSADVRAAMRGDGVEEAARRVRYAMLDAACRRQGATCAVTAHHADDQAETVLLQILRGCGPEGPTGIAPVRDLSPGVRLIRPVLHLHRTELVAHCRTRGLDWRDDPSNADQVFRRNQVRISILPEWERRCPGIGSALAALATKGRCARDAAEQAAGTLAEGAMLPVAAAQALDPLARAACWRAILARLGIPADRNRLRRLEDLLHGHPGRRLRLGGWLFLRRGWAVVWSVA
jgi:tRNA(Ile)-lysidine synthase